MNILNFFQCVILITCNIQQIFAYYETCDKELNVSPNGFLTLSSRLYTLGWNSAEQAYSCRYTVRTQPGYILSLTCDLYLDATYNAEAFYISTEGLKTMNDKETFFGTKSIYRTSLFNVMTFSLISLYSNANSVQKFSCTIRTIKSCDCGWSLTSKIFNGVVTQVNEYTSMAGIVYAPAADIFCGGAIIHTNYVLTAAHCFSYYNNPNELAILVGDHDITTGSDTIYSAIYTVQRIISHPYYNKISHVNDIALVKTNNYIQYNRGVGPVCLPFNSLDTFVNKYIDVAGWGTTSFGGIISNVLRKVTIQVISNTDCLKTYNTLTNNQICTKTPGRDSCQKDSGGNLYYRGTRMYTIGIISYGGPCTGDVPTVNTRITSYLDWIVSNLNITTNDCFAKYSVY